MYFKVCSICKKTKPLNEYRKNVYYKDNLMPECKDCSKKRYFSQKTRETVLERDKWTCQECGIRVIEKRNYYRSDRCHIDHIIPHSKGGNSDIDNLQVLCMGCNLKKSKKLKRSW